MTRFERKFHEVNGCWQWSGNRINSGYGMFWVKGKNVLAHRHAYRSYVGSIPDGMCVLHRCDNRGCVNPDHLWLGTRSDNSADMVAKGRSARGARNPATRPGFRSGTRNGRSKLTPATVVELRKRYASGGISQQKLGDEYGVCQVVISKIINRQLWPHVP
jgi:hypothetical protein